MSKHTPGPWRDAGGGGRHGFSLQVLAPDGMSVAEEITSRFDARLIAAAPELLEALKAAHDVLLMKNLTGRAYEMARAAIAKAEGES